MIELNTTPAIELKPAPVPKPSPTHAITLPYTPKGRATITVGKVVYPVKSDVVLVTAPDSFKATLTIDNVVKESRQFDPPYKRLPDTLNVRKHHAGKSSS